MRVFAQAHEVFDGGKPARKAEDDIDRDQTPQLKPGEGRPVDAEPQRLTDDHVRFSRRFTWKATMKKINNGQDGACDCHQRQDEKTPARPDVWKCLGDEKVQSAPAREHKQEGRDAKWSEVELFIH